MAQTITFEPKRCRACRKKHGPMEFRPVGEPSHDGHTHEATCPDTSKIVPLWHVDAAEEQVPPEPEDFEDESA